MIAIAVAHRDHNQAGQIALPVGPHFRTGLETRLTIRCIVDIS